MAPSKTITTEADAPMRHLRKLRPSIMAVMDEEIRRWWWWHKRWRHQQLPPTRPCTAPSNTFAMDAAILILTKMTAGKCFTFQSVFFCLCFFNICFIFKYFTLILLILVFFIFYWQWWHLQYFKEGDKNKLEKIPSLQEDGEGYIGLVEEGGRCAWHEG